MRVVFLGTPAFSVPVLAALLDAGYEVAGVFTQPDRPAGRGQRPTAPPAKQFAQERGLAVYQPASLRRDAQARQQLAALAPDVIIVAAYGLLVPPEVLGLPPLGCLNVHPSLLPRYRGASPVAAVILNGDPVTGVTIMKLDEGMDTGPIVAQRETPIGPDETADVLTARLFQMGAGLLLEVLPRWGRGEVEARPQDEARATVTQRLQREDGRIDWGQPADRIARQVRAYHPWPGTFTYWRGRLLKVLPPVRAEPGIVAAPGQVVALPGGGVGIGAGQGVLAVQQLQMEGRRALGAAEFLLGYPDFPGSVVGA